MCGVIGLIYERERDDFGQIAGRLLQTLEYRGYDSTGAAIQSDEGVWLAKGVGAPSKVVGPLGITARRGRVLCGQVRWATFGVVDEANAQPHEVRCKTHLYGAHNGNVTNCDALQAWLREQGHEVRSDNDGEMVVHCVEHAFAAELADAEDPDDHDTRRRCMRRALIRANERITGGYAAVVVDPVTQVVWAVKRGSSLYFGIGEDRQGGRFGIASSDLSSVLQLTRVLVSLSAGEFIEFSPEAHDVYRLADGEHLERAPTRSRLQTRDTALQPPYRYFMEQEIAAQSQTCRDVVRLFTGGSERAAEVARRSAAEPDAAELVRRAVHGLVAKSLDADIDAAFARLETMPAVTKLDPSGLEREAFHSAEAALFADLGKRVGDARGRRVLRLADGLLEAEEVAAFGEAVEGFVDACLQSLEAGGRIYTVCCGSSYHAAKAAALFFDAIAGVPIVPIIPGEFRGQYANSLRDGDLVVAVSQSGETKDLVDVLDAVEASGRAVDRVALVNNLNSTIAQEKARLVVPLRCGPEIAVPATKSFMNQLVVFYCLALRLAERLDRDVGGRREGLTVLGELIEQTLETAAEGIEAAAERLDSAPSIHILGTRVSAVALEGALKIREVVLNHTQGYEASEFKHGPNTILGFNTLLGYEQVAALLAALGDALADDARQLAPGEIPALLTLGARGLLDPTHVAPYDRQAILRAAYVDYPLLYVTTPDKRDVALTVSQMNTHKIRGASTFVIAEPDPALCLAASKPPADNPNYHWGYIELPATGDPLMTVFTATVALQRLALRMCERKMARLDALNIPEHGVHPDVPKNVSKSITVD